jgi:uncharacterized protein (TIGR02246 family)
METSSGTSTDEARIRQLLDDRARALHAKDAAGVASVYAPDVMWFDLAPPLRYVGAETYRHSLEAWFATWKGPIGYETRDLSIVIGGDVAFCHGLSRLSGQRTDGAETDVWVRGTLCLQKIDGRWAITHEHFSVPFYMDGSFRAAVDLTPG